MFRIGIYPGAFDPIHAGHLLFARAALRAGNLDKIYFLPEPRPRHKQGVKALEHRVEMVLRAVADEPQFGVIALTQARSNTLDTLPQILARFADTDLVLISGERILRHLPYWLPIDSTSRITSILVGLHDKDLSEVRQQFQLLKQTTGLPLKLEHFIAPKLEQRSLSIRKQLRAGEMPAEIPLSVQKYIRQQGLYALISRE